jgi:hypothetical protein
MPTPSPTPGIGSFVLSGSMLQGHYYGIAVQLADGKVLVAGGYGTSGLAVASAELYDPATGTFTATGSMTVPRVYAVAALLANGRVLVAGGEAASPLASAEVYDPATGTFTATGSMHVTRSYHSATLLANGSVLVAGGGAPAGGSTGWIATASAEIYDPGTGQFTPTGSMTQRREDQTATLLANGQVLLAGGDGGTGGTITSTAELYNPATGTFASTAGPMTTPRLSQTATLLANGRVLLAGGDDVTKNGSAEVYDPQTGMFTATGAMAGPRFWHAAARLTDGRVLVVGGDGVNCWMSAQCKPGTLATSELYDPATGAFTAGPTLHQARDLHWIFSLAGDKAVVIGGAFNFSRLVTSELYTP